MDLATSVYSRVATAAGDVERMVLTANANALVYQNERGIFEASTGDATPVAGIPAECVSVTPQRP